MIVGIGVDVVDLARFERAVGRTPGLIDRLFAPAERGLPLRSLAGRFAAKEAFSKAVGTGFKRGGAAYQTAKGGIINLARHAGGLRRGG